MQFLAADGCQHRRFNSEVVFAKAEAVADSLRPLPFVCYRERFVCLLVVVVVVFFLNL
jgi:hypothetical protein